MKRFRCSSCGDHIEHISSSCVRRQGFCRSTSKGTEISQQKNCSYARELMPDVRRKEVFHLLHYETERCGDPTETLEGKETPEKGWHVFTVRARGQRDTRKKLTCIHSARLRAKKRQKKVDMYSQCALWGQRDTRKRLTCIHSAR